MKLQITIDGRAYEVDVELLEEEETLSETHAPFLPPAAFEQTYPLPKRADLKVCRSPVTGLTIKVCVEPGQTVEAGYLLMVLEAMKMETNVLAPIAATVKAVHVRQGDSVKLHQTLLEFE